MKTSFSLYSTIEKDGVCDTIAYRWPILNGPTLDIEEFNNKFEDDMYIACKDIEAQFDRHNISGMEGDLWAYDVPNTPQNRMRALMFKWKKVLIDLGYNVGNLKIEKLKSESQPYTLLKDIRFGKDVTDILLQIAAPFEDNKPFAEWMQKFPIKAKIFKKNLKNDIKLIFNNYPSKTIVKTTSNCRHWIYIIGYKVFNYNDPHPVPIFVLDCSKNGTKMGMCFGFRRDNPSNGYWGINLINLPPDFKDSTKYADYMIQFCEKIFDVIR